MAMDQGTVTRAEASGMQRSWEGIPARIVLQPVAAPSILGLFGFAGATFIVAANMAGWYGDTNSPLFLFPFAALFGGLAQFLAGMWAYHARDGLATAMHGMWGSFWIAYGVLYTLFATGVLTEPSGKFVELGFWFVVLGAITWMGAFAALGESLALFGVLATLAAGSTLAAIGEIAGTSGVVKAAGDVFVASAIVAWYVASAMMLEGVFGRVVLPIGKYSRAANVPGGKLTEPVEFSRGMPGVRVGQ